jgi:histidyl-tRNA synthetase
VANRLQAKIVLIIGQKESLDGTVILRDMESGMQEIIDSEKIVREVKKRMKNGN